MRISNILAACAAGTALLALATPATALSMQECSDKYKAAQKSGAATNMNWSQFRAAECAAGSTMKMSTAKPKAEARKAAKSDEAFAAKGHQRKERAETGGPSMAECSASYRAAKQAGTLGDTTWNAFRSNGCVVARSAAPTSRQAVRAPAKPNAAVAPAKRATKAAAKDSAGVKVSERDCSARYQAAKAANALGGMTWNAFRSAGCPAVVTGRAAGMVPTAAGMFPTTIARRYAHLPAGRARMLTCRDQYAANKAAGMDKSRWSVSGGGFYSECNRRLSKH